MKIRAINRDFAPHRTNPNSIADVATAVSQLDASERTLVTFEVDDDHHMGIGGGGGRYIVYMTKDNRRFYNLINPEGGEEKVMLTCGGQEGDFRERQCVDIRTARAAAVTFAMTGEPDPQLAWEPG